MRLRTLLALVFAAGALLLTAAATTLVSQFVAARVQIRAEAHTAELAEHLRQIIDANIAERLGDMAVLSSVARTNATRPEAQRAWVDALRESFPAYAWIGFADRSGTVVASTGGMLEGRASPRARGSRRASRRRPSSTSTTRSSSPSACRRCPTGSPGASSTSRCRSATRPGHGSVWSAATSASRGCAR
ncbi:hypothetical protein R1A27_33695 (plasmid) [Methylobacterium sp. NMS12]|uniref:hypothetical protein n=1 Tax=Methylobacterium sp. NMS12 TaxID=3079766 RepID=UPI003F8835CD